jgi:hypothetical protein
MTAGWFKVWSAGGEGSIPPSPPPCHPYYRGEVWKLSFARLRLLRTFPLKWICPSLRSALSGDTAAPREAERQRYSYPGFLRRAFRSRSISAFVRWTAYVTFSYRACRFNWNGF